MANPITIKGQSLPVWKKWIKKELTPPITCGPEAKYVVEAFSESIKIIEQLNSKKLTFRDFNNERNILSRTEGPQNMGPDIDEFN